jgi:hypothetical protein
MLRENLSAVEFEGATFSPRQASSVQTQKEAGAVNLMIQERATEHHLSLLALARRAGLPSYHRLIRGAALTASELSAIEAVLGPLEPTRSEITPMPLEV